MKASNGHGVSDQREVQKVTLKGVSHKSAESEARTRRQDQTSSTKHNVEWEHPAGRQRASQATEPFFVETVVLSSMSFVMTPQATDMEKTSMKSTATRRQNLGT